MKAINNNIVVKLLKGEVDTTSIYTGKKGRSNIGYIKSVGEDVDRMYKEQMTVLLYPNSGVEIGDVLVIKENDILGVIDDVK